MAKEKNKVDKKKERLLKLRAVVDRIFEDTQKDRKHMDDYLKRYNNEWYNPEELKKSDSKVTANLFFSTVTTIAPMLTDNKPIWHIMAKYPYLEIFVQIFNDYLAGYLWAKLDMDMNMFKWALNSLIMKMGVIKVYFDPETDEVKVEIVDSRNFFFAPGYTDLWEVPLCGERASKPISWIRSKYPDTGSEVKPDSNKDMINTETFEQTTEFCTVYEIWMKDDEIETYYLDELDGNGNETKTKKEKQKYPHGRLITFAGESILEDKPCMYKHGKPPYVILYDYLVPGQIMGMGEAEQIIELNKSFIRNLQLMDRWTTHYCDPPWLIDTDAGLNMDKVKKDIVNGGGIYEYSRNMSEVPISKVQSTPIDPTVLNAMTATRKLIEEISGVTEMSKGMPSKQQRQSATEFAGLMETSNTRTRQRVRNLEWSIKRLLYLMLNIMQQFYTEPRSYSVKEDDMVSWRLISNEKEFAARTIKTPDQSGMEPEEVEDEQKNYDRFMEAYGDVDEIYADFDLTIETNSTLPMDKQSLANIFLRLLELAAGNPATAMPMWEATLERLQIPKSKEIIEKMNALHKASQQQPGQQVGG